MKKKEIKILIVLVVAAVAALGIIKLIQKKNAGSGVTVAIYYRDQIVKEFDPAKDAVYTVKGDYGTLDVEVKDDKWHVTNEECPNHICHQMGWVGPGEYLPITCLPNNIVVVQEGSSSK